jgi:hypothetical protein
MPRDWVAYIAANAAQGCEIEQDLEPCEVPDGVLRAVCAGCGWALDEKPVEGRPDGVSHGLCAPCMSLYYSPSVRRRVA